MNQSYTERDERASDAALSWVARLRADSVSEQDMQAFSLWLCQEPAHKQAMDEALELWDDLGAISKMPFAAQLATPAANSKRWLASSVAIAAALVLAVFLWPLSPESTTQEFQTALGERQSYQLQDNSTLTLNTNSRVTVNYDEATRYIELIRGEAFFEVTRDPDRPFNVNAGSARVTVLGTAFNIHREGGDASITVTEGVVRVTEQANAGSRAPATEILRASQHLKATRDGLESATSIDIASHVAWQQGKLIAQEMPLPTLVNELERYRDLSILISDPEVATMTISGVFELDKPDAIIHALELSLGLQAVQLDPRTIQLLKADQ